MVYYLKMNVCMSKQQLESGVCIVAGSTYTGVCLLDLTASDLNPFWTEELWHTKTRLNIVVTSPAKPSFGMTLTVQYHKLSYASQCTVL